MVSITGKNKDELEKKSGEFLKNNTIKGTASEGALWFRGRIICRFRKIRSGKQHQGFVKRIMY
jgi:hypothetical protein